MRKMEEWR